MNLQQYYTQNVLIMKKPILLLLLLSITIFSFGQIKQSKEIDNLFSEWNKDDVPGAALGIIKNGDIIYSKGYGIADLEHDIEISPSSVFYIGSVSKQFVTFCVLLLEEKGKLKLDDRIQKYLPDFPEYGSPLTIRHFIHHTSGVRDYLTLMYLKGRNYLDNTDVDEVYELIKKQKELNFEPGEKYLYSNSCYFMLAMIVEKAAGQSIKKFADEQIFKPLGMKNTLFYDDNTDVIKNRVFSYEKKENEEGFNNLIMRFDLVGSGGVYSNVEDLYLWDQNFYNNKLGKGGQEIILKMHEEGLLNNGKSSGYAFALHNGMYKGLKTVSHGGSLAGYRAQLMRFPDQNFSIVILANRGDSNPTRMSYAVADILLKEDFIPEPESKSDESEIPKDDLGSDFMLSQLTGNYEVEAGLTLEITQKSDSLFVYQSWNESSYSISKKEGNIYETRDDDSPVLFMFSELKKNYAQKLTIYQNGNKTICPRKEEIDFSSLNLNHYIGEYYSAELDASYSIFLESEILKLKIANYDALELSIYDIGTFTTDNGMIHFNRENNKITAFVFDAGRVSNIKFMKK